MAITRQEFDGFMENWDEETRVIIKERLEVGFRRERLENFSEDEARLLVAMLARMIPQDDGVDLVGFLDWAVGRPLGRGDRMEGLPPEPELFNEGLKGVEQSVREIYGRQFMELESDEQDEFIKKLQEGRLTGSPWERIPPSVFFVKLLTKALIGYCSHPALWMRMGFPGPSYPEGYVWISRDEVRARRSHRPGWKTL